MKHRLMTLLFGLFGSLSPPVRRAIIRLVSPKFTMGAICFVQRSDGDILLVRHSYTTRWGTVGGLAKRGERPDTTAVRECLEEVGLEVVLTSEPAVVVDPVLRRVDVVFAARPADHADPAGAEPTSAEITEVRWFGPEALPAMSKEAADAWVALRRAVPLDNTS
jgi:8-oxo-dGTP pyrophosphatase MutT (NUDIX family)